MMTTKHNHQMSFGRREAGCPRCAELNAGAPTIKWGSSKAQYDRRAVMANRNHNCQTSHCGPVCTFGDW